MKSIKKRRSYDLDPDAIVLLNDTSELGYVKERVVSAGIRLFVHAPLDLRNAALSGNMAQIAEKMGWIQQFQARCLDTLDDIVTQQENIRAIVMRSLRPDTVHGAVPPKTVARKSATNK